MSYILNGIAEINTNVKLDLFLIKFYIKALKKIKRKLKYSVKGTYHGLPTNKSVSN